MKNEKLKTTIKNQKLIKLKGTNMDIDLISDDKTSWKQMRCPWNEAEKTNIHKCAVKNISICKFFCGIEFLDNVICCYPNKNILVDSKIKNNFKKLNQ